MGSMAHFRAPHQSGLRPRDQDKEGYRLLDCPGKYDNEFVKENGEWKILKLRPICWLRTPYHKDFLECPDCRRTPSPYYPPDEPPRISSFNPDEGSNPDKWGPLPHEHIVHK